MNSVIITIMTLAVQLIVIILASFALGKLRPWGSGFIEILFLSGLFITSEMLTIPNFTTLKAWGLNGTRLALLLPYVTLGLPTATFIMINCKRPAEKSWMKQHCWTAAPCCRTCFGLRFRC